MDPQYADNPLTDEYYAGDDIPDDSILESLIIIGLAGTLAFLVYYRQQRQNQHRRNEGQRAQPEQQQPQAAQGQPQMPGQQADGGFFPPPGDPNYANWVAGGVGH